MDWMDLISQKAAIGSAIAAAVAQLKASGKVKGWWLFLIVTAISVAVTWLPALAEMEKTGDLPSWAQLGMETCAVIAAAVGFHLAVKRGEKNTRIG